MPRVARQCPGGYVYHIWNRGAGRLRLFKKPADYLAFERVLVEAHARHPIPLLERTKGDVDDSGAECPERGGGMIRERI